MPRSGKITAVELFARYQAGGEVAVRKCFNGQAVLAVFPEGGRESSVTWTPHRPTQMTASTPSSGELVTLAMEVVPELPEGTILVPLLPDTRKQTCTVGRGWACGIKFRPTDVSRMHARFSLLSDGEWMLEDLNSPNGTFIDGVRLIPHHSVAVHSHREIRFADVRTMFLGLEDVLDICQGASPVGTR